jgi:hypothetical protein
MIGRLKETKAGAKTADRLLAESPLMAGAREPALASRQYDPLMMRNTPISK